MENNFAGKKITVMGLGLFGGGVGVTRFLARRGAHVTITDLRGESELTESIKMLDGLPVQFALGGHKEEDFKDIDMLVVNPAVPKDSPYIHFARQNNVPFETEMNIFFKLCPAPIIGITGTNGKSTTTSFLSSMLQNTGRKTWTGGNIGYSLLEHIDEISPEDIAILELSSFQLEDLQTAGKSPHIAVVTNIAPNHLDRHKDMQDYINAKKGILRHQKKTDYTILNYDDPELRNWAKDCVCKTIWISTREKVNQGAYLEDNKIILNTPLSPRRGVLSCLRQIRRGEQYAPTSKGSMGCVPIDKIKLPGIHNVQNVLAAAAAASIMGATDAHIAEGASSFAGLEHRLEFVSEINGVRYYNDSKATTPESAIAAINAFNEQGHCEGQSSEAISACPPRVVLIAGGYDKGASFERFAEECAKRVKCVILIGKTAKEIASLIKEKSDPFVIARSESDEAISMHGIVRHGESAFGTTSPSARNDSTEVVFADSLKDAVEKAKACANTGDVILLSPACASYDMFINYEERGRQFKELCNTK